MDTRLYNNVDIPRVKEMIVFFRTPENEKRIDLSDWFKIDRERETIAEAKEDWCGTLACAAGQVILRYYEGEAEIVKENRSGNSLFRNANYDSPAVIACGLLGLDSFFMSWADFSYDHMGDRMDLFGGKKRHDLTDAEEAALRFEELLRRAELAQSAESEQPCCGYSR
jgi:hypothetical protein